MKIYTFQKTILRNVQYPHALGECKLNYFEIPPYPSQNDYHK